MADPETVELHRGRDLRALEEEPFSDETFCLELYRALAGTDWSQADLDGAASFSYRRAETLVNEIRHDKGLAPLELVQTGGEGEVSGRLDAALGAQGWRHRPAPALLDWEAWASWCRSTSGARGRSACAAGGRS
jgi:hypothetical protein